VFAFPSDPAGRITGMDRESLKDWLDSGLSLEEIGALTNRDASTIGYWCRKHGLEPNGRAKHAWRGGLTRQELEPMVERGMSVRQIASEVERSQSTVRHWLKHHGLKTTRQRRRFSGPKPKEIFSECRHHGRTRFILEGRNAYRCTRCRSEAVSAWRRRSKRRLVEARGGACELCGYNQHPAALQFHHSDPEVKEFNISNKGGTIAFARLQEEAEKCVLVCANCHALLEWGVASLGSLEPGDSRRPA
jgi:hypothetical protein